jgi:hypothetical protein
LATTNGPPVHVSGALMSVSVPDDGVEPVAATALARLSVAIPMRAARRGAIRLICMLK